MLGALVAQRECIEIGEKVFAGAEENWADSEMQFVNEAGLEILADCAGTAAKPNILPVGCLAGKLQRRVNAISDKKEGRAAVHSNGLAGVIG
jgi:hypothetical protein